MTPEEKSQPPVAANNEPQFYAYVLQGTEYERGWGSRPDGYVLFSNITVATAWSKEYHSGRDGRAPDEYTNYTAVGTLPITEEAYRKMLPLSREGKPLWFRSRNEFEVK